MNNVKDFPKSRTTVVDIFPYFKDGFKQAMEFSKQHNVPLNSSDGVRVLYGYCLKHIRNACKQFNNKYPTVLCLSKKSVTKKLEPFVADHFLIIARFFPLPYCGRYDLSSPELEMAAENLLLRNKKRLETKDLAQKLKLKVA